MKNIVKSNCLWDKDYTTAVKGFAILCVILSHIANFWSVRWFTPLGGIGVAMKMCLLATAAVACFIVFKDGEGHTVHINHNNMLGSIPLHKQDVCRFVNKEETK